MWFYVILKGEEGAMIEPKKKKKYICDSWLDARSIVREEIDFKVAVVSCSSIEVRRRNERHTGKVRFPPFCCDSD